jgi:hypothetical protein
MIELVEGEGRGYSLLLGRRRAYSGQRPPHHGCSWKVRDVFDRRRANVFF